MASVSIRRRETASGPRFQVRYRLGGRAYPIVHAGSFPTLKEARARRDLIGGEIANGRNPADLLRAMVDGAPLRLRAGRGQARRPDHARAGSGEAMTALAAAQVIEAVVGQAH
jgi:hypothetical protein